MFFNSWIDYVQNFYIICYEFISDFVSSGLLMFYVGIQRIFLFA
jgi:hypothetical protein